MFSSLPILNYGTSHYNNFVQRKILFNPKSV